MNVSESLVFLRELNRSLRLLILDERTTAFGGHELQYRTDRDQVKASVVGKIGAVVGSITIAGSNGKNGKHPAEILITSPRISKADMAAIRASVAAITRDALEAQNRRRQAALAPVRAKIAQFTTKRDRKRTRTRTRAAAR